MTNPGLDLPVSTQCRLRSLARSNYYYESTNAESDRNLFLMEEIDRLYLVHPENGSRMMTKILRRRGHEVNRERVRRLMQLMGLRSRSPQLKTTKAHPDHSKYPYLLRGLSAGSNRSTHDFATSS
jgi:putative transposase